MGKDFTYSLSKILGVKIEENLNPVQDGPIQDCSRMEEGRPSLKFVTHILQWWELIYLYLIQKKIQKLYEARDTTTEFCWHQHISTGNQQNLHTF